MTQLILPQVDLDFVPWLNDNDLKQMGITALGPRRKILAAAAKLAVESADHSKDDHEADVTGGIAHDLPAQGLQCTSNPARYLCVAPVTSVPGSKSALDCDPLNHTLPLSRPNG